MKQQFSAALLCLFASMYFLLSCKKESATIPENGMDEASLKMSQATKTVPIKGTYATVTEILSSPPLLQLRITGIGQSSHLGEGKFVALSTLNLTTPPPFHLGGTATFYAANGDVFYTEFNGLSTPNEDGTSTVIMTHKITGGTGRFENASGTFTGFTIAGLSNPLASITYDGNISY